MTSRTLIQKLRAVITQTSKRGISKQVDHFLKSVREIADLRNDIAHLPPKIDPRMPSTLCLVPFGRQIAPPKGSTEAKYYPVEYLQTLVCATHMAIKDLNYLACVLELGRPAATAGLLESGFANGIPKPPLRDQTHSRYVLDPELIVAGYKRIQSIDKEVKENRSKQ